MDLIKAPDGVSDEVYEKITWMQIGVIRKARKIKQGDIADVTGIKQTTLSHIEHGRMVPSERNQHILATYFQRDDWHDNKQFDWDKDSYSTNNLTLFIHELQKTIDWSGYHHLVAEDIGMSKELVDVLKSRSSLKNTKATVTQTAPLTADAPRPPVEKIDRYDVDVAIETVDYLMTGVWINDQWATSIPTPSMLQGKSGAYALTVINSDMDPRYSEGDTVFVDPNLPPVVEDDVVITLHFAERSVAIIRQIHSIHIDEPGDYCAYEFDAINDRWMALYNAGVNDTEMLQRGNDPDVYWDEGDNNFEHYMKERRLLIGMDDLGNVKKVKGESGSATEKVLRADVHVIVGLERKPISLSTRNAGKNFRMKAGTGEFKVTFGKGGFGSGPFGG